MIVRNILNKILTIVLMIAILMLFPLSSVSEAKIKLKDGQYYYSGTQEAEVVVDGSLWDKVLKALASIANYLLGIWTLGIRGIVVGAIEICEILLTLVVDPDTDIGDIGDSITADVMGDTGGYSQTVVTVQRIIFNEISILNANIFQ